MKQILLEEFKLNYSCTQQSRKRTEKQEEKAGKYDFSLAIIIIKSSRGKTLKSVEERKKPTHFREQFTLHTNAKHLSVSRAPRPVIHSSRQTAKKTVDFLS